MKTIMKIVAGALAITGFCVANKKFGWNAGEKIAGAVETGVDYVKDKFFNKTEATETIDSTDISDKAEDPS